MTFADAKEQWEAHDDWQFADRDACWKFFYEQGREVPMKYRRMEHNARLQTENERLLAREAKLLAAAEQWALYVIEDCAPCTLVEYLERTIK